jgi:hypothetical protein
MTSYNPWIGAAAICSNQDLSFIATKTKGLTLVYYITIHATKDEVSTYGDGGGVDSKDPVMNPPTE